MGPRISGGNPSHSRRWRARLSVPKLQDKWAEKTHSGEATAGALTSRNWKALVGKCSMTLDRAWMVNGSDRATDVEFRYRRVDHTGTYGWFSCRSYRQTLGHMDVETYISMFGSVPTPMSTSISLPLSWTGATFQELTLSELCPCWPSSDAPECSAYVIHHNTPNHQLRNTPCSALPR